MTVKTQADALKAMQILHDKGPTTVVLSSTSLGAEGVLLGLASSVRSKMLFHENMVHVSCYQE